MRKLLFFTILLLLACCTKEASKTSISFTGILLKNCSGEPCVNCLVSITNEYRGMFSSREDEFFSTTTDSLGNFTLSCNPKNNFTNLDFSSSRSVAVDNSIRNVGTIIRDLKANFALRIKIDSRFTDKDTLLYPVNFQLYGKVKIPCSVKDTILPPLYDFSSSSYVLLEEKNYITPTNTGFYSVYWMDSDGYDTHKLDDYMATMKLEGCTGRLDTVTVFIQ